ncbi:MAG: outer membrane protein assembly factor BamE [Gammaproteobacteria bacterium]
MLFRSFFPALIILVATAGCFHNDGEFKLPGVYRLDVQQGNVIEQEMIDKLKPGMLKNQVRFIMGTPAVIDPFHPDRWDYIYTFSKGGGKRKRLHVTLHFKEDKLTYLDGDIVSALRKPSEEVKKQSQTVDVPLGTKQEKKGFFSKMLGVLPFVGDDEPSPTEPPENKDKTTKSGPGTTTPSADSGNREKRTDTPDK